MKCVLTFLLGAVCWAVAGAMQPPEGLVSQSGDQSVVLHWERNPEANLAGYRVYRATTNGGPFALQTPSLLSLPAYCDLNPVNGRTNFYRVTAISTASRSARSDLK